MADRPDLLTNVLEHIIQGVVMYDSNRKLALWNKHYQQVLQFPDGYLRPGLTIFEMAMITANRGDYGAGDPETLANARIEALYSGDTRRELTVPGENADAADHTYEVLSQLSENNELVITYTDITERERTARELRDSEERFRDFAESSADWFWEMDADLRFTYMSPNVERIIGVPAAWHYGKTRQDLLGEGYDRALWDDHLQALQERQPFRDFSYVRVGDGIKPTWLSSSGVPIFDTEGAFRGYRGIGRDLTEQKAVEAQLIQADKLATLGTLAAGTAHELSQPLNIIRLVVDSILYQTDDEALTVTVETDELKQVVGQVLRMAEIIDQMRILSRRDQAGTEAFMPARAVRSALRLVERQFASKDITIESDIPERCRSVRGSTGQLQQVVLNLVSNAGFAVDARAKQAETGEKYQATIVIQLVDEAASGDICITVSDNGGGIDETVLKNIFDPFFTTKEVGEGTGLGLSVSRSIIEAMGGRLDVSVTDGGTHFDISLPAVPAET